MLIQFTVENFYSLKNETTLSLLAGKDKEHEEYLQEANNERVLPTVAIYGANAAGKTNIMKAITAAVMTIRTSNDRQFNDPLYWIVPFAFDHESINKPSRFDFIFINNGKKFQYGFLADNTKIYEEYLYEYKTARDTLIFERTNTNQYKFNRQYKKVLNEIVENNTPNKLFLATATSWNAEITRDAYMWFANKIDTYNDKIRDQADLLEIIEKEDEVIKPFIKTLLKNADINIFDYDIESKSSNEYPPFLQVVDEYKDQIQAVRKTFRISTMHKIINKNGVEEVYRLPLSMESNGTSQLFFLGPIIKHALDYGKTIFVDELDNSLHPLLMDYIIDIFNNKDSNPNNAQLIFNSHSTKELSLDIFRRDQIYFTEKDDDSGITELYSLDEFSVRKSENINKGYLQGRYGAIPTIGSEDLL